MQDPETILIWTCPHCGYWLRVLGPWNGAVDLFLGQAERHAVSCPSSAPWPLEWGSSMEP